MSATEWDSLRQGVEGWWSTFDVWWADGSGLSGILGQLWNWERVGTAVELARPIGPFAESSMLSPLVGAAGALAAIVLLGVAASSAVTLLAAVLALGLLLSRLFGLSLELTPFAAARAG